MPSLSASTSASKMSADWPMLHNPFPVCNSIAESLLATNHAGAHPSMFLDQSVYRNVVSGIRASLLVCSLATSALVPFGMVMSVGLWKFVGWASSSSLSL